MTGKIHHQRPFQSVPNFVGYVYNKSMEKLNKLNLEESILLKYFIIRLQKWKELSITQLLTSYFKTPFPYERGLVQVHPRPKDLIFFSLFWKYDDRSKVGFSLSDFGSPAPLASLFRILIPVKPRILAPSVDKNSAQELRMVLATFHQTSKM